MRLQEPPEAEARRGRGSLARRLAGPIVVGAALVLLGLIGPPWLVSWWTGLRAETRRLLSVGFLESVLVGYGLMAAGVAIVGPIALARVLGGRSRRKRRPAASRLLLLCLAGLFSLILLEAGAWGFGVLSRLPPPPPPVPPKRAATAPLRDGAGDALTLLVLGESSAEGQPYQPWLSIGHLVAWQIERAQPGRAVRVIMAATGGVPLAHTVEQMEKQTERPDLVLLCSGHNEFQARWGWTHVVNYYEDDALKRPRDGLADRVGDWTPFCGMIRDAVDRQEIDRRPSPREIRDVVERPVCEPETRARVRDLFEQELDMVALWCERAGALPIFVLPAGNDVGFDPDRSVLAPGTPPEAREAFGREFAAVKASESASPEAAIAAYRALIARQPTFAESHYRLALLLQEAGKVDEARAEFVKARDLDGLPMRCPTEFQDAYRAAASRHDLILVDAPERLEALSPSGLLDDHVFHDGQHPTFRGYLDLAQSAVDQLAKRGAFGLGPGPPPRMDPEEAASHFGMTSARWAEVCRRSAQFWGKLAAVRYDPEARRVRANRALDAARAIEEGAAPESVGMPGLGVHPRGFPRGAADIPDSRPEGFRRRPPEPL